MAPALARWTAPWFVHGLAVGFALLSHACTPGAAPGTPAPLQSASCGSCHAAQWEAFETSRHARSASSELFIALRERADAPARTFCDRCHDAPIDGPERGVGCIACHTAVGNQGTSNARLVHDRTGPMRGVSTDPFPTSAHRTEASTFLPRSELCGTCHEVDGPGGFVETPFTEWIGSPAARDGIRCADCHMSPRAGDPTAARTIGASTLAPEPGQPLRRLTDHRFVGPDHTDAMELLGHPVSVQLTVRSGTDGGLHAEITVRNENRAHAFPSGARFAREAWLEVSVADGSAAETVVRGGLDDDGAPIEPEAERMAFHDLLTRHGSLALPLDAAERVVRALPAAGARSFDVPLPVGARTVRARIRFRAQSYALRHALGLVPAGVTALDLAHAEATVR